MMEADKNQDNVISPEEFTNAVKCFLRKIANVENYYAMKNRGML